MDGPANGTVPSYPPPPEVQAGAHVKTMDEYRALYEESISHPEVRRRLGT